MPEIIPCLVKEDVAAERLGIAPRTLARWRWAGCGPAFVKVGRRAVRYDPEELSRFIAHGRRAVEAH
jgi:predicted site-specific integrase-resolvase